MYQISDNDYSMDMYQKEATKTASYPDIGYNLIYPALGLAGEAGEVAEKIKKLWRNYDVQSLSELNYLPYPEPLKQAIIKEMGDTLWYIAALCNELNITLADVAKSNLEKLKDRKERDVIKGEGDNR